ncbi:MAG TPA: glycosyltransferase family 2 protein [Bauldia sp.]|nr:glycosyltransferase family 2 protein [Bauldia sp.]
MATLDILIPHFNDVHGLDVALKSIAAQTWRGDLRVVIVDDGSTRDALHGARLLAESFAHPVTFIENGRNRGRPYTRNVLLDSVDSPYLAWLDAGDEWFPEKLAAQFDALAKAESEDAFLWMTCHYHWQWRETGTVRVKLQKTDQDQLKALLIGTDLRAYLWTILAPARTFADVGWFDERLPRLQDLDYFLRFVLKGGRILEPGGEDALCVYHKTDLGRSADQIRECNAYIFDKYRVLYNRYGTRFLKTRLFHMEMHSARFAANNEDYPKANRYMWRAARAKPRLFLRHLRRKGLRP